MSEKQTMTQSKAMRAWGTEDYRHIQQLAEHIQSATSVIEKITMSPRREPADSQRLEQARLTCKKVVDELLHVVGEQINKATEGEG